MGKTSKYTSLPGNLQNNKKLLDGEGSTGISGWWGGRRFLVKVTRKRTLRFKLGKLLPYLTMN